MLLFVLVYYCTTACQRSDWPRHKTNCFPVRVADVGAAGTEEEFREYIPYISSQRPLYGKIKREWNINILIMLTDAVD
jgi:hypothetical protein